MSNNVQVPAFVSIIIPCFNQAHFLSEAIESVLAQSYKFLEILVIDDGSTDNTMEVASGYPAVQYIRQANQGLSAARNTGIRFSKGMYLLFLDADDRLLPQAIEDGLRILDVRPEYALVFGKYRLITRQGTPLVFKQIKQRPPGKISHYAWLLQGNHIAMHATVLYRRSVFDAVGGFNDLLPACEDYDLYLRITRHFPIAYHENLVAEYRMHGENMSGDLSKMLAAVLAVLRFQRPYIRGNPLLERMYWRGVRNWVYYYSRQLVFEAYSQIKLKDWKRAYAVVRLPIRYSLVATRRMIAKATSRVNYWLKSSWRRLTRLPVNRVNFGELRRVTMVGEGQDKEELTVDRYYETYFFNLHAGDVKGNVLEIANDSFVSNSAAQKKIFHQESDLKAGEYSSDSFDCIVLQQILHFVYDLRDALEIIYRILKPGGVLLATLPGMLLKNCTGDGYWSFTGKSSQDLFFELFPPGNIQVRVYGNSLAATASLHRLPANSLLPEELNFHDPQYPILISVRAVKPENQQGIHER